MTTRKIIDIEHNGEKVWPKGHAKATFMSDGSTVEDAIAEIKGSSPTTPDLSSYATKEELNNKVDKVSGKQLTTEDFTTLLKQKLEGLSNYDDAEISQDVSKLRTDLDTLVSGDTTTAIKTFNEVIAFLDGISDTEDLSSIIASIEQQIAGKMDKVTLAAVATSGSYNDLKDKPTIPSAVNESTVSGWGFTKNKGTVTSVKINGTTKTPDTNGVVDLATIEGGGGSSSGEDIRYFTKFTVEQFVEGCETESPISYETSELFNAIKNNKIICVPYEGHDRGFVVASYKGGESDDYPDVFLQIGAKLYHACAGDSNELVGSMPSNEIIEVVEKEGSEEEAVGVEVNDNTIYVITEVSDYIIIAPINYLIKGSAVRFTTGNNTTLEFVGEVKWANGVIPTIEPNTYYELSLVSYGDYIYAVLTPFF